MTTHHATTHNEPRADAIITARKERARIRSARLRMASLAGTPGYSDALRGSNHASDAARDAVEESFNLYTSIPESRR